MNEISLDELNKLKKILDGEFGTIVESKRALYSSQQSLALQRLYEEQSKLNKKIQDPLNYQKVDTNSESLKRIAESRVATIDSELIQIQNRKNEINSLIEVFEDMSEDDITRLNEHNDNLKSILEQLPSEFEKSILSEINQNNLLIDFVQNNNVVNLRSELAQLNARNKELEEEKIITERTVDSLNSGAITIDLEQLQTDMDRLTEIKKIQDEAIPYLRIDINDLIDLYNDVIDNETIIHKYGLGNFIPLFEGKKNASDDEIAEYNKKVKNILLKKLVSDLNKHIAKVNQADLDAVYDEKLNSLQSEITDLNEKVSNKENYVLTEEEVTKRINLLTEEESYYKTRIKSLVSMLAVENNIENRSELDECFKMSQEKHDYIGKYNAILKEIKKGAKYVDGFAMEDDKSKLESLRSEKDTLSTKGPEQLEAIVNKPIIPLDSSSPVLPVADQSESCNIIKDNTLSDDSQTSYLSDNKIGTNDAYNMGETTFIPISERNMSDYEPLYYAYNNSSLSSNGASASPINDSITDSAASINVSDNAQIQAEDNGNRKYNANIFDGIDSDLLNEIITDAFENYDQANTHDQDGANAVLASELTDNRQNFSVNDYDNYSNVKITGDNGSDESLLGTPNEQLGNVDYFDDNGSDYSLFGTPNEQLGNGDYFDDNGSDYSLFGTPNEQLGNVDYFDDNGSDYSLFGTPNEQLGNGDYFDDNLDVESISDTDEIINENQLVDRFTDFIQNIKDKVKNITHYVGESRKGRK